MIARPLLTTPTVALPALSALLALGALGGCRGGDAESRSARTSATAAAGVAAAGTAKLPDRFGLGRPATREEIARLDTDVDTTGAGLPPGRGTVAQGAAIYAAKCAACHGAKGEGIGPYPKLVQPVAAGDSFPWSRGEAAYPKTVGNYWPYATTLYDYVGHAMPYPQPRSLTPDETYALVAFLLAENGVVPRDAVMDARALTAVRMPMRGRFVRDDREGGRTFR